MQLRYLNDVKKLGDPLARGTGREFAGRRSPTGLRNILIVKNRGRRRYWCAPGCVGSAATEPGHVALPAASARVAVHTTSAAATTGGSATCCPTAPPSRLTAAARAQARRLPSAASPAFRQQNGLLFLDNLPRPLDITLYHLPILPVAIFLE